MTSEVEDRKVLTPRPEAGELLEVGLWAVDREGLDDLLYFAMVGERTEDDCGRNSSMSTRPGKRGIGWANHRPEP
jgi:hypothetical protein